MWARQSHLLHPFSALTSNTMKFNWTDVEQKEYDNITHAVIHNTLLSYPDFNRRFDIHTDDSSYQVGAVIIHVEKPIVFYRRKFTGP